MPLRPILSAQASLANDNRVTPGRVVEYEQHSKSILAVVTVEKKGKWGVLNQSGGELDLPADRLTLLPGSVPKSCIDTKTRLEFLSSLQQEAAALQAGIELEEVWQLLLGESKEATVADVAEIVFSGNTLAQHLAVRRALLTDQVFFKRKKTTFEPRPESVVAELKVKVRVEEEKRRKRDELIGQAVQRLKDPGHPLPDSIALLEQLAALGKSADGAKEIMELVETIAAQANLQLSGRPEDRAFKLLVAMKHFSPDENLLPLKLGRPVRFSEEARREAERIAALNSLHAAGREDLRGLDLVTIDGEETRDFDDALSIEEASDGFRIGIHITEVAELIPTGSILDDVAMRRATSVYCPDEQYPMLPAAVCEQALSLIESQDRYALSVFLETDRSFNIRSRRLVRTLIKVKRRLTYEEVDKVLYGEDAAHPYARFLQQLWSAASHSESLRMSRGALQLNRRELNPKVLPGGRVVLEESTEEHAGRRLVSEMMILANESAALFGREHKIPMVYRAQEPPDEDVELACKDIPEGPAREYYKRNMLKRSTVSYEPGLHAGLGVEAYIHATSPIRRMIDLLNQRQLVSFIERGAPEYRPEKITEALARLEQGLDEASLMQRNRTRYWLLKYLVQEQIKELQATIVRIDGPKPLAELELLCSLQPFHPLSRIDRSESSAKRLIGKQIRLRVESIDPRADVLVLREIE